MSETTPLDDVNNMGDMVDVKMENTAGAFFIFVLALILLFALLRAQKRNRKLLEEKVKALEKELEA